jgi:hypothetical protein
MTTRRTFVAALLLLGAGCAPREQLVTSGITDRSLPREVRADGVAVAPVVLVRDLAPPALAPSAAMGLVEEKLREGEENLPSPTVLDPASPRDAAFLRDEYLGNIRFGGGFIRTGDVALEVRARIIELGHEDEYTTQGLAWLTDAVPRALAAAHVRLLAPAPAVAPVPERRRFRGLHPDDGHDDVNLPRIELVPTPADAAARTTMAGSRWVLVPYLRAYYTHNGGWFLGQQFGCTAGARVDAMVALYDTTTGQPVWWMPLLGRHIEPMKGSPSTAELDQYLLWAEHQAEAQLTSGWLR